MRLQSILQNLTEHENLFLFIGLVINEMTQKAIRLLITLLVISTWLGNLEFFYDICCQILIDYSLKCKHFLRKLDDMNMLFDKRRMLYLSHIFKQILILLWKALCYWGWHKFKSLECNIIFIFSDKYSISSQSHKQIVKLNFFTSFLMTCFRNVWYPWLHFVWIPIYKNRILHVG